MRVLPFSPDWPSLVLQHGASPNPNGPRSYFKHDKGHALGFSRH